MTTQPNPAEVLQIDRDAAALSGAVSERGRVRAKRNTAYQDGADAFGVGLSEQSNIYSPGTIYHDDWHDGFIDARRQATLPTQDHPHAEQ